MPTFGSMVQKGKLAAWALAFSHSALNMVDCRGKERGGAGLARACRHGLWRRRWRQRRRWRHGCGRAPWSHLADVGQAHDARLEPHGGRAAAEAPRLLLLLLLLPGHPAGTASQLRALAPQEGQLP
jgi:hypothetical protein